MKHLFIKTKKMFFLLVFVSASMMSCEKSENTNDDKWGPGNVNSQKFNAKLKKSFCGFNIVEIVDTAFYSYGMNWVDNDGNEYKNVFTVNNYCEFNKLQINENETFVCQIVKNTEPNNCIICQGFLYTPPLKHNLKVIK